MTVGGGGGGVARLREDTCNFIPPLELIKENHCKFVNSEADPGFSFRGGAKDYVRACTSRARSPRSLIRSGSRARLRALEALGGFDALSCYLNLVFKGSGSHLQSQTVRLDKNNGM